MSRGRDERGSERGVVTAELAVALPVLLAVTVGLVWLLSVGAAQLRVVDAARETARAAARGDEESAAVAAGTRVAPEGASVRLEADGERVVAVAEAQVTGPGGLFSFVSGVTVSARAEALAEREGSS